MNELLKYSYISNVMFWSLCFGWLLVLGLYKDNYLHIIKFVPFDYTAFAINGKVRIPETGSTT